MNVVNLTPHELCVHTTVSAHLRQIRTFPPSGAVARVSVTRVPAGRVAGVHVTRVVYGDVTGLPEPVEGTIYVVSGMVAAAVPERADVYSPGELLRREDGTVYGCDGLSHG